MGFDLKTGQQRWSHPNTWQETHPSVRNMASADGVVAVLFEIGDKESFEVKKGMAASRTHSGARCRTGQKQFSRSDFTSGSAHQKRVAVGGGRVWAWIPKGPWLAIDAPDTITDLHNTALVPTPVGLQSTATNPNGVRWLAGESFVDGSMSLSQASAMAATWGRCQPTVCCT